MIVENSVYWIRELIAHCQRKYQHNSYSDSNGPLCEDLQDPQQHSCKKLNKDQSVIVIYRRGRRETEDLGEITRFSGETEGGSA